MNGVTFAWVLLGFYAAVIIIIAWIGIKKTKTLESFAIGSRNYNPIWVGISLSANLTSAATFVINPGLIYLYGFSGFLGYAIAMPLGLYLGLIIMSKSFRKIGDKTSVLTVPQWIGDRYGDSRLTLFYAILSLLQVTFLVLIVVGLSLVISQLLQIEIITALLIVIIFTFSYILLGGANAHIFTNSLQGIIMFIVALTLTFSVFFVFDSSQGSLFDNLFKIDPNLVEITNPTSLLFRDIFEVFIMNFFIGIAIILQPHVMSKSLYLRSEKDVNIYLTTTVIVATVFFMVLLTGLYARVLLPDPLLKPDMAIPTYIVSAFSPTVAAFVSLGVLAAGFSTMEGLLIAISSIISNDFYLNLFKRNLLKNHSEEQQRKSAFKFSRYFLIFLAPVVFFLSLDQINNPSLSVAIFAQNGVYGLFAANFVPILFGIFYKNMNKWVIFIASLSALIVHFGMYYFEITMYHNNPGVPAFFALVTSTAIVLIYLAFQKGKSNVSE